MAPNAPTTTCAGLTQVELANRLADRCHGDGFVVVTVSNLQDHDDRLLSTLAAYIEAAGATTPRIALTVNGIDMELELPGAIDNGAM